MKTVIFLLAPWSVYQLEYDPCKPIISKRIKKVCQQALKIPVSSAAIIGARLLLPRSHIMNTVGPTWNIYINYIEKMNVRAYS